jgi:hypothetical protein
VVASCFQTRCCPKLLRGPSCRLPRAMFASQIFKTNRLKELHVTNVLSHMIYTSIYTHVGATSIHTHQVILAKPRNRWVICADMPLCRCVEHVTAGYMALHAGYQRIAPVTKCAGDDGPRAVCAQHAAAGRAGVLPGHQGAHRQVVRVLCRVIWSQISLRCQLHVVRVVWFVISSEIPPL